MRANAHRPPGDVLRRKALMTRLRALRRTRKRVLAATPGGDVVDLDSEIARLEGMLGFSDNKYALGEIDFSEG